MSDCHCAGQEWVIISDYYKRSPSDVIVESSAGRLLLCYKEFDVCGDTFYTPVKKESLYYLKGNENV